MLYSILIFDEPDTAHLRDEYRQRHLDYLKAFDDQTVFAGPFVADDESADLGSLRFVEFDDHAAAEKHVTDEPYVIGGIQKRWKIHPWRKAVPQTWRDCPREEGNIQAMFYALDKPDSAELRKQTTPDNLAYLEANAQNVITRGPMLDDAGEAEIGSIFILDVPDMQTAHQLKDEMPFTKVGLFGEVVFHRWRFGRVFDRFKL